MRARDIEYGEVVARCLKPVEEPAKTWIAIELVGEDDKPMPEVAYRVVLPSGEVREGSLDQDGMARFNQIDPGTCVITFPDLDKDAWEPL